MGFQKSADGIVGFLLRAEGLNMNHGTGDLNFDDYGEAEEMRCEAVCHFGG